MAAGLSGARMSRGSTGPVYLCAHPQGSATAVHSIAVDARLTAGGSLSCRYELRADMARVRVPPAGAGRRADELWRHTCFEAFVGATGTDAYYEFNFSPARDWAAYRFAAYRTGMTPAVLAAAPELQVRGDAGGLEVVASVQLGPLSLAAGAAALRVALAAVIEDADGGLGYWALRHPPGRADFHHPESFTLELAPT
ncbi:MAG: DOMON-like domain-containing protein [Gammaproteobacteria bacterium]|nr:DOMON-like domain-containing protein [Gammaproteobacteria bacterium]